MICLMSPNRKKQLDFNFLLVQISKEQLIWIFWPMGVPMPETEQKLFDKEVVLKSAVDRHGKKLLNVSVS